MLTLRALVWRVCVTRAGACWRVLYWRVGAHRLAHAPADRSSGGDRHPVLLERDVVEGEGGHRTQRGRDVGEPVELRPARCGECSAGKAARGSSRRVRARVLCVCWAFAERVQGVCRACAGACFYGRMRAWACLRIGDRVRRSVDEPKNTSRATALPAELRSTKKLPGEVAIGPWALSARPGSPKM